MLKTIDTFKHEPIYIGNCSLVDIATMLRQQQAEIEALKTDLLFFQKEKSKEDLKLATRYFELTDEKINEVRRIEASKDPAGSGWNLAFNVARAILRRAQE